MRKSYVGGRKRVSRAEAMSRRSNLLAGEDVDIWAADKASTTATNEKLAKPSHSAPTATFYSESAAAYEYHAPIVKKSRSKPMRRSSALSKCRVLMLLHGFVSYRYIIVWISNACL